MTTGKIMCTSCTEWHSRAKHKISSPTDCQIDCIGGLGAERMALDSLHNINDSCMCSFTYVLGADLAAGSNSRTLTPWSAACVLLPLNSEFSGVLRLKWA